MKEKRWILMLVLGLLLSVPAAAAEVAEETEPVEGPAVEMVTTDQLGVDLPDNDTLFAQYVDRLFYGPGVELQGTAARDNLDEPLRKAYDILLPQIQKVANGENGATSTEFTTKLPGYTGDVCDALDKVLYALCADRPYELYWFGNKYQRYGSAEKASLDLCVSANYSATQKIGTFTTDPTAINRAKTAKENADRVIADIGSRNLSDLERLEAYKDYICGEVEYNYDALNNTPYGDPWQMISVFDGNPDTNVVCEGYSKAFQYLCDQTKNWQGDVRSILVTSDTHMWNVVRMNGGNYLVDVTNCDANSTADAFDKAGNRVPGSGLFMRNESDGHITGNDKNGYTVTIPDIYGNGKRIGKHDMNYMYSNSTKTMYGEADLVLNAGNDLLNSETKEIPRKVNTLMIKKEATPWVMPPVLYAAAYNSDGKFLGLTKCVATASDTWLATIDNRSGNIHSLKVLGLDGLSTAKPQMGAIQIGGAA